MIIFLKNLHIYVDLTATHLKRTIISINSMNTEKKPHHLPQLKEPISCLRDDKEALLLTHFTA